MRAAKQFELQLYTQKHVLAKTQSHSLLTIEPLDLCRSSTLAARAVIEMSSGQPFYILMSSFSNRKARLLTRVAIAQTTALSQIIQALHCKVPPIDTFESESNSFNSRICPPNKTTKPQKKSSLCNIGPRQLRNFKRYHIHLVFGQKIDTKRLAQEWRSKDEISVPYSAYCNEFIVLLTEI